MNVQRFIQYRAESNKVSLIAVLDPVVQLMIAHLLCKVVDNQVTKLLLVDGAPFRVPLKLLVGGVHDPKDGAVVVHQVVTQHQPGIVRNLASFNGNFFRKEKVPVSK